MSAASAGVGLMLVGIPVGLAVAILVLRSGEEPPVLARELPAKPHVPKWVFKMEFGSADYKRVVGNVPMRNEKECEESINWGAMKRTKGTAMELKAWCIDLNAPPTRRFPK